MRRIVALFLILIFALPIFHAFAWQLERPSWYEIINERSEANFGDNKAAVGLGINISSYTENEPNKGDFMYLNIVSTANTRKIINYDIDEDPNYQWHQVSTTLNLDDDDGVWVSCWPLKIRFYGGVGSAEYENVWVCSNGFVSFEDESTAAFYQRTIPDGMYLDGFVAPFWRDLKPDQDSSIKYGLAVHDNVNCFVVSWENIPDKYGARYTFQLVMEGARHDDTFIYLQSRIWFQYQSIAPHTLDPTTIGIEDQEGSRGVSYDYDDLDDYTCLCVSQASNYAIAKYLVIEFTKGDSNMRVDIDESLDWIRGYNVKLHESEEDPTCRFAYALTGVATLLFGKALLYIGVVKVMLDVGRSAAGMLNPAEPLAIVDDIPSPHSQVNAKVETLSSEYNREPVDVIFGIRAWWMLDDVDNLNHSLTVTSKLIYHEYDSGGGFHGEHVISCSANLDLLGDSNNDFDTAKQVSSGTYYDRFYLGFDDHDDYFKLSANQGQTISLLLYYDPIVSNLNMYLFYPDRIRLKAASVYIGGGAEKIEVTADETGVWYIKMNASTGGQIYQFHVSVTNPPGGPPGGCPFVFAWNGSDFVADNNLLPMSESSNYNDVEDYYKLEQPLVPSYTGPYFSTYFLKICEFESEHSYLDQIELFAVDHEEGTSVAVTPTGAILTYETLQSPKSVIDQNGRDWLQMLSLMDNKYYQSDFGTSLVIDFGTLESENAKLVLREDYTKTSIHVQILTADCEWLEIGDVSGRVYWATDILDLSPYLPIAYNPLIIRLYFTAVHKIDFVGLDTTPQAQIQTHQALLFSAIHSTQGSVWLSLILNDGCYAELTPNQHITLKFLLPTKNPDLQRTFILYTEGHYYTIQQ
jgi:hypothetical protein